MLRVWMPMVNGTSNNQGLTNPTITDTNIVANANGKLGKCCEFNGTDSRILMEGDFGTSVLGGDWTICMWIYDTRGAARECYFSTYGLTSGVSGGISLEKTAAKGLRVYWNGNPDWTTGFAVPDNEWFHLAVVHRDNNVYVYVNGQLTKSNTAGTFTASKVAAYTKAALGRDYHTTTPAHKGYLQDFRLYDTALDDRTIKKISHGLVFHYSLSGGGAGQENLLKNSLSIGMSGSDGSYKTIRTFDNTSHIGIVQISETEHGENAWRFLAAELGGSNVVTQMTTGEYTYTFSCDIKITNYTTGDVRVGFDFRTSSPAVSVNYTLLPNEYDGNWHRISMVITGNDTQNTQALWGINTNYKPHGSLTIIQYKNPKLEVGNKATGWTLNSADDLYEDWFSNTTTEYDLSGNGYHAIKNNITQDFTSPRNVSGGIFNGTNSWVRLENNNWMIQKSPQLTINYWASSDNWTTYYRQMFSCTESGGFNCEAGSSGYLRFARHVYTNSAQTSTGYQLTGTDIKLADLEPGYHMFTFVYDTTGSKVYVDGELSNKYDVVSYGLHYNFNSYLYIGCEANGKNPYSPYFNGSINDFRLYYTVLDADEIKLLYDGNIWETDGGDS